MSLVLLGRVKFSLGLRDLHRQNFLKDIASRSGLFLLSNFGALCVCFSACVAAVTMAALHRGQQPGKTSQRLSSGWN